MECVSKNGNMLLNVGPDAKGKIPKESLDILSEVGDWISRNGSSIYGCGASELPKPEWGRYTQRGNKLYAHVFEESIGPINLAGLAGKVRKARLLADGSELILSRPWNTAEFVNDAYVNFTRQDSLSFPLPDPRNTVIELELL